MKTSETKSFVSYLNNLMQVNGITAIVNYIESRLSNKTFLNTHTVTTNDGFAMAFPILVKGTLTKELLDGISNYFVNNGAAYVPITVETFGIGTRGYGALNPDLKPGITDRLLETNDRVVNQLSPSWCPPGYRGPLRSPHPPFFSPPFHLTSPQNPSRTYSPAPVVYDDKDFLLLPEKDDKAPGYHELNIVIYYKPDIV